MHQHGAFVSVLSYIDLVNIQIFSAVYDHTKLLNPVRFLLLRSGTVITFAMFGF